MNQIFEFIVLAAKSICMSKNTKMLNLDDLAYLLHRWSQCSQILQRTRFKGDMSGKKIPRSFQLIMTRIWPYENEKKWYEICYEKGTLRETIKLVGSSIDRKVYVQISRKTMLRMSYAHIVSLYDVIWVIRSLFWSFQRYSTIFF